MVDLLAVLALSVVCAGWVLIQRWAARQDPDAPGIVRDCGGCHVAGGAGACEDRCRGRA